FELYWVDLQDAVPELSGGLDEMLPQLVKSLPSVGHPDLLRWSRCCARHPPRGAVLTPPARAGRWRQWPG
ncbi:MAG: hypothetical protein ACK2T6_02940, partial [Anaerolineae bacterium]